LRTCWKGGLVSEFSLSLLTWRYFCGGAASSSIKAPRSSSSLQNYVCELQEKPSLFQSAN
jgi:hypothetical protein